MRVLDVGCGESPFSRELWPDAEIVRLDQMEEVHPDVLADVREIPAEIGKFDVIVASHILEHLQRTDALPAVKHWATFLEPEGEMYVFVPDLVWAAEQLIRQRVSTHILMHIFGGQQYKGGFHQWGYTMLMLRDLMYTAGLTVQSAWTAPFGISYPVGTEPVMSRMLCVKAGLAPTQEGSACS